MSVGRIIEFAAAAAAPSGDGVNNAAAPAAAGEQQLSLQLPVVAFLFVDPLEGAMTAVVS